MRNQLVEQFMDALINGDQARHPLNDVTNLKNEFIDSPNNFLKQKTFTFKEVLADMHLENRINFFPSDIKGGCYETAIFVSFRKPPFNFKIPKNNLIPIDTVLKEIVKQVLGSCFGINQEIILITDDINNSKSEEWFANLKTIQEVCKSINIYYVFDKGDYENVNRFFGL